MPLALQEEHHAEQEDREPHEVQQQRHRRPGERPAGEQIPLDQRVRMAHRPPDRQRNRDRRDQQQHHRLDVSPAPGRSLHGAEHEQGDRRQQQHRRDPVRQPAPRGRAHLRQDPSARDQRGQPDRHVDEEDPAPVDADQQPADRRPGGGGDRGDPGPDPDHHRVLPPWKRRVEQPERGRDDQRRADGLRRPRRHQPAQRGRGRAGGRGEGEHEHPDKEEATAAEVVGQPPGRHQQRREDDRVGVQHPGQPAQRRPVVGGADRRQRHVHDEQVELGHESDCGQHRHDPPARGVRSVVPARLRAAGGRCLPSSLGTNRLAPRSRHRRGPSARGFAGHRSPLSPATAGRRGCDASSRRGPFDILTLILVR
jgi:hypothetical protein